MPELPKGGRVTVLLEASHLSVSLGGAEVLHGVDMTLSAGEIVTVVGPNGSGKSTLLRSIIGAVPLSHGSITVKPNLRIGYVPQKLHIDPTLPMTVARFLSLPKPVSKADTDAALKRAGVLDLKNRQMAGLSGGQFQRVLLARALLSNPELLILDEATQGLDQAGSAAFYAQIDAIRAEIACAVLMVSHELHVVMAASDRVICLNGHVCCEGAPAQVASAPEYRALFGSGTHGALALYRHEHNHSHDHDHSDGPTE
jgi:zinc transport system ATP-binding protein